VIIEQFELGLEGILPKNDRHYIKRGLEVVDKMTAAERKTWLQGIQIAREVGKVEVEMEVTQLQDTI